MALRLGAGLCLAMAGLLTVGSSCAHSDASSPAGTAASPTRAAAASMPKVLKTIKIANAISLAVSPTTSNVYVLVTASAVAPAGVVVLKGGTYQQLARIPLAVKPPASLNALAVSPKTGDVYVTTTVSANPSTGFVGDVRVISGKTSKVIADDRFPAEAQQVTVSPKTGKVYVVGQSAKGGVLTVIDGATQQVTGTVVVDKPGPDMLVPVHAAVSPVTGVIYVTSQGAGQDTVSMVQPATGKVSGTVGIGTDLPIALSVSAVTGDVYAALNVSGQVVEISGKTGKVTGVIKTHGMYLAGVAVSPRTGNVYIEGGARVVNYQSGPEPTQSDLWVASGKTGKIIATVVLDRKEDVLDGLFAFVPKSDDLLLGDGNAIQVVAP